MRSRSILFLLLLIGASAAQAHDPGKPEPKPEEPSVRAGSSPSGASSPNNDAEETPEEKRLKLLSGGSTEDANALLVEFEQLDSDKKEAAINGLQDQVDAEKDPEKKAGLELALGDLVTKLGAAEAKKLAGNNSDLRAIIDQERKAQLERATLGKHNPIADARLSALEGMMRKGIADRADNAREAMKAANERFKVRVAASQREIAAMDRVDRAEAERALAAAEKELKEFDVARVQHHEKRYREADRAAHAFADQQADSGSFDPKSLVPYSRNNLSAREGIAVAQKEMSPQAKEEIDKRNNAALAAAKDREERAVAEVAKAENALDATRWWLGWGENGAKQRLENAENSQLDATAAVFQAELQAKGYQPEPKPTPAPKPLESKPLEVVSGVRAVNEYTDARHTIHKNGNQTLKAVPVPGGGYASGIASISTDGGQSYSVTALSGGLSVDTKTGAISQGAAVETGGLNPVGAIRTAPGQYSVVYGNQNKERIYGTPQGTVNQISADGLITPRTQNAGTVTVSTVQKPGENSYIPKTQGATTTLTSRLLASAAPIGMLPVEEPRAPLSGSGASPVTQQLPNVTNNVGAVKVSSLEGPAPSKRPLPSATPPVATFFSEVPGGIEVTPQMMEQAHPEVQALLQNNPGGVLIASSTEWCGPCRALAAAFPDLPHADLSNTGLPLVPAIFVPKEGGFTVHYGYEPNSKMALALKAYREARKAK